MTFVKQQTSEHFPFSSVPAHVDNWARLGTLPPLAAVIIPDLATSLLCVISLGFVCLCVCECVCLVMSCRAKMSLLSEGLAAGTT